MAKKESKYRIGFGVVLALGGVAVICDIIGLIPGVETVLTSLFWVFSTYVLRKHGVPILNGRKLAVVVIDIFIGLWPAFQALPQITLGIILVLLIIYAEDRMGLKIIKGGGIVNKGALVSQFKSTFNSGGVRQPPKTAPLNDGGVRQPVEGTRNEAGNVIK
jgi:hypothetical protein